MKYFNSIVLVFLIHSVTTLKNDYNFFPNLPVGEYRVYFKGMLRCVPQILNQKMQFNYFLSKKSSNETEIKGNATFSMEFDDSFNVEVNMAVRDSIGGWKNNAVFVNLPNACSTIQNIMGKSWVKFLQSLGYPKAVCPIPVGTYVATGLDTEIYKISNFPKTFFYGTYRFRLMISKKNETVACIIAVLSVKRPWEIE